MDWSSDVCSSDLWWGPEGRPGSISGDWANGVPASFGSRARGVRVDIAMHAFAALLDSLVYTRPRNAKLRLIGDYLRSTPDPDRGWSLAALTGDLDFKAFKPALIRALIEDRVDPVLFRMSRDSVGDTAGTVELRWPGALQG